MDTAIVTTDIINSPQAQAYFTRADRRVMIGLRAALEMLRLPVPEYALRRKSGPTPAKATIAAFAADNPAPRSTVLPERKPNASPERLAAAKALHASRLGHSASTVFGQVFPA